MFNNDELQLVISGNKSINIAELSENVIFKGYNKYSTTINHLWEVLYEFNDDDRALFLLFVTSCSRPPTLGFKSLKPFIQI